MQCAILFPITTQASISVIVISGICLLLTAGIITFILFVKYERSSVFNNDNYKEGSNVHLIITHTSTGMYIRSKFTVL